MEEITKNGVTFKNVPNSPAKGYNGLLTNIDNVSNGRYLYDDDSSPLICALDINWAGIEVENDKTINTTDELISWIKSNKLSDNDKDVLNECKTLITIIKDYLLRNGIESENTYYWYAGPEDLNESTMPGSSSYWHILKNTNVSNISTGDLTNDIKVNWVLAVPTICNLNNLSNGEIVTDLYDISEITFANGASYKVFRQIEPSKRLNLTFIQ